MGLKVLLWRYRLQTFLACLIKRPFFLLFFLLETELHNGQDNLKLALEQRAVLNLGSSNFHLRHARITDRHMTPYPLYAVLKLKPRASCTLESILATGLRP